MNMQKYFMPGSSIYRYCSNRSRLVLTGNSWTKFVFKSWYKEPREHQYSVRIQKQLTVAMANYDQGKLLADNDMAKCLNVSV